MENDTKEKDIAIYKGGVWWVNGMVIGIMHDCVIVRKPEDPFHLPSSLEKKHNLH